MDISSIWVDVDSALLTLYFKQLEMHESLQQAEKDELRISRLRGLFDSPRTTQDHKWSNKYKIKTKAQRLIACTAGRYNLRFYGYVVLYSLRQVYS